ncbi:extracellular solute-binding protein [Microlunatus elymi]|uniref:Extracellular solute-binding protein n=1 Tax=Microlunatus elymi TaxID=2596828 RepID=A0A516PYV8_9ACTN|nr:extracellular solute-binding protein [Microlunatus elymi]QDP96363.1 extracellular solute-binding protein [Microlunatus elymi]
MTGRDGRPDRRRSAGGRLLALLLAVSLGLVLAACSGSGDSGSKADKQTIRFAWWGDSARQATTRKVLDAFQQENPGITVEIETTGDTDAYFTKLATEMSANDAPDVMTLGGAYPREYSDRGALLDLGKVSGQLDLSKFPDSTLAASKFGGAIYGVPTGGNAIGMMINPKIFAAARVPLPDTSTWTWSEFVKVAGQLSAHSPKGTYGFEPRVNDTLGVYAQQRGKPIFDAQGKLAVAPETIADYWRMEQQLIENLGMPSAAAVQELANVSPEQTLMGQGKAAMTIGYSNLLGTYAQASGADLKLVTIPGAHEYQYAGPTVLPSQYYAISARSKHTEAAAKLLSFMVNSPTAAKLILDNRGMPFQTEVAKAIEPELDQYGKANAAYLTEVAKNGTPTAPIPPAGGSALNDITSKEDSDVLFGRATPDAAAEQWQTQLQQALAESK